MRFADIGALVLNDWEIDASRADGSREVFLVRMRTDQGLVPQNVNPRPSCEIMKTPRSPTMARSRWLL